MKNYIKRLVKKYVIKYFGQDLTNFDNRIHELEIRTGIVHPKDKPLFSPAGAPEQQPANDIAVKDPEEVKPTQLEVGEWYKNIYGAIFCYTGSKDRDGCPLGYGLYEERYIPKEEDISEGWNHSGLKKATHEEVSAAIIEEAKRRYKVGDLINRSALGNPCLYDFTLDHTDYQFIANGNRLEVNGMLLFNNGIWAEVEQPKEVPWSFPERWFLKYSYAELPYINRFRNSKFLPALSSDRGCIDNNGKNMAIVTAIDQLLTEITMEQFYKYVINQSKEIDWSLPGQLVINKHGDIVISHGNDQSSTFKGAYILVKSKIFDWNQRYFQKSDFKLYPGPGITLSNG